MTFLTALSEQIIIYQGLKKIAIEKMLYSTIIFKAEYSYKMFKNQQFFDVI